MVTKRGLKIFALWIRLVWKDQQDGKIKWLNQCLYDGMMLFLLQNEQKRKYFRRSEHVDFVHVWKNKVLAIVIINVINYISLSLQ
jgi:hypothetical protein